jgi:exodeoxyribonuclease VII large subunit
LHLAFEPKPGLAVVVRGRLTIYPEQGSYQLVASRLVPSGAGAAQAALEALKKKLQAEGLFDPARKRSLPRFPAVVGVVTSSSGAVAFDIVRILRARWPGVEILFAPVLVQGPEAPASIVNGIRKQALYGRAEVLIVGRGGGSAEDLAAFNDERVVRAIASCPMPVVSAVGHETDVTLSDLAADVRAATPSRAAELVVPDARECGRTVNALGDRLRGAVSRELLQTRRLLQHLSRGRGFYEPQLALEGAPRLAHAAGKLAALDPSSVLGRGYALCATEDGSLVRDGAALHREQTVRLRFARGGADAEIRDAWSEGEETR